VFCEKEEKKSKCPKKNFQSVERGVKEEKNYKCGISGVRKKRIGRKILEEKKNQSVSWGKKIKIFVVFKRKLKLGKMFGSLITFWLGVILIEKFDHMGYLER
jgi:hypothetical protein